MPSSDPQEATMSSTPVEEISREKSAGSPPRGSTAVANPAIGLHAATAIGDRSAVQLHLARGAEPGALSAEGWAPLHLAAAGGDARMVKLLLHATAPTDQRGGTDGARWPGVGATPLHCAVAAGHLEVVETLLRAGAPVDSRDGAGFSALHLAAATGQRDAVRALVKAGADPFARVVGSRALDLARRGRHHDTAALLMQVEGCRARGASPTGWCSPRR
jgi:uncharacterized protein